MGLTLNRELYNFGANKPYSDKAKNLIPGGSHTYSKGPDQFPSDQPFIVSHGKGCKVYDMAGNEFTDFAMSLGTVTLGHAYEPVLKAVEAEIYKGVNFTRPSVIEGELAELLTQIIPSAEMVKFAKNGSDATTAAVKLSRAYTGRDYVARCKNDPFNSVHDWFIGSTVINRGVPKCVRELTLQFEYNNIESVKKLFAEYPNKIACFLLEPLSFIEPTNNFLQELKNLCEKNGSVLIFDEVVSGFRFRLGGAQELLGVKPHLTALGKAMANGFSVSALVGQRDIMKLGGIDHDQERVFLLSTTHGGETHSLAAAKATITEIMKHNVIDHFWKVGESLQNGIRNRALSDKTIDYIQIGGYGCKPSFGFVDNQGNFSWEARTYFLQESLKRGLMFPYVVPSFAHTESDIKFAIDTIGECLLKIKAGFENGDLHKHISGEIVKPVFRKFN